MPRNGPNAGGKGKRIYPNRRCRKRLPIPEPLPDEPWTPLVEKIWGDLRGLPHSVDFSDSDWTMAHHGLINLNRFYTQLDASVSLAIEGRKVLDSLGFTLDARQRLGIEYISEAEYATKHAPSMRTTKRTNKATDSNANIYDLRNRLSD